MKIGLVLDDSLDSTDGVQQYVLGVGGWLAEQGHEVHYLVGETERSDLTNVHSLGRNVRVRFNGNRLSSPLPASRRRIRELLDAEQFDVLHVQVPYSPWLAARIIKAAGPKTAIIGTFHIAPYSGLVKFATRLLGVWLRPSLKRFDTMVSVSAAAALFAKQTFGIATSVVPNVVDYQRFHAAKPFAEYDDKTLTILFLGRLVPRKGCQVLLQAVAALKDLPDFRVLICGKGPLEAKLKQFVAENGLEKRVIFTGFVDEADKPRYYASADLAVFPSSGGESFGIVLIEAMSSGQTAVLAGDNSGYASVLSERPELLFPPLDASVLAAKIRNFLLLPDERAAAAKWGLEHAKQFDTAVVGQQLLTIYAEALRK